MDTRDITTLMRHVPGADAIFAGVFACDHLPLEIHYPCALIANTDPAHKPGEHWVGLFFTAEGKGEYFDSFGLPPPHIFETYLKQHSRTWSWNTSTLQDVWTEACGPFCIFFIIYCSYGKSMTDIVQHLQARKNNDEYVMQFVKSLQ